MKKYLSLLLAVVMLVSVLAGCGGEKASDPTNAPAADGNGSKEPVVVTNADRKTVTIRFAQFGNSVDDIDGMKNDPIKAAIEAAVNVTLEYDTGVDGFDDRMQTELFTGGAAELFPTWGETDKIAKWAEEDLVYNIAEIINAEPERYPTLYKIINTEEYKAYNALYTGDAEAAMHLCQRGLHPLTKLLILADDLQKLLHQLVALILEQLVPTAGSRIARLHLFQFHPRGIHS